MDHYTASYRPVALNCPCRPTTSCYVPLTSARELPESCRLRLGKSWGIHIDSQIVDVGIRVVGVETNPALIRKCSSRAAGIDFEKRLLIEIFEILRGSLVIVMSTTVI